MRHTVARAAQAMIDLLDILDGDSDMEADEPDLEHDGREPSICDLRG